MSVLLCCVSWVRLLILLLFFGFSFFTLHLDMVMLCAFFFGLLSVWFGERGLCLPYLWPRLGIDSMRAEVQCLIIGVAGVFCLMC